MLLLLTFSFSLPVNVLNRLSLLLSLGWQLHRPMDNFLWNCWLTKDALQCINNATSTMLSINSLHMYYQLTTTLLHKHETYPLPFIGCCCMLIQLQSVAANKWKQKGFMLMLHTSFCCRSCIVRSPPELRRFTWTCKLRFCLSRKHPQNPSPSII